MKKKDHELDLQLEGELDLFAEEVPERRQNYLPNSYSLSTFTCECSTLSTFYCYGCNQDT
jgi:hypothetical protein